MDKTCQIVAVAALIFDGDRLLCMRRSPQKDAGAGTWETLSGRVELGEDPEAAVLREVEEETSLEIELDPRPVTAYAALRGKEPMTVILYRAKWKGKEVRRSEEHDEHAWLTPDEFAQRTSLEPLVDAARLALRLPW